MGPKRKEPDLTTYVGRVAARIRRLRERAGLTPAEFAERVSRASGITVSVSTAYAWENGHSTPNLKMLPPIASALGLSRVRNVLPDE